MFSYVKALVSRVVLGPSDKVNVQKENSNEDTQEMIQLIKFRSGEPGSQRLDIFVEVGTAVAVEQDNTADEAEERTEETSENDEAAQDKNEEAAQDRENSWRLSEDQSMRRKRVGRMSLVNKNIVATVKDVVAEEPEAEEEIGLDGPESICSRPTKFEVAPGSSSVENILILSSPDPDSSPSSSLDAVAGQSLSPISDSDPVAELFPVKVKRSFTLRPTLRSLNR